MNAMKGLTLVVALLVVANLAPVDAASSRARKKPQPAPAPTVNETVTGNGRTAQKALATAKKNAVERVEALLRERFEPSGWQPTEAYLAPDYLEEKKVIQPEGEPEEGPGVVGVGEVNYTATYRVRLTPEYLAEVVKEARQQTVQERHQLLARVLAGILAVVLVAAGYLRLEEMTHGYATKLLRLAAVALLGLVGAALLLIG